MTSDRAEDLRAAYIEVHGAWDERLDGMLELGPELLDAYLEVASVPRRRGALEPKVRELVLVAVNAATTHLHVPALRAHVRQALRHGSSRAEIMEVYELTTVLGMHTCNVGVPLLVEELRAAGDPAPDAPLSDRQLELKRRFLEERGNWGAHWDDLLRMSPELLEAYLDFSMVPWRKGHLEPKVKELVYIAINSSTTHLYEQGLRVHIHNALKQGATAGEVMEVFELVSGLGFQSCPVGVPLLVAELDG